MRALLLSLAATGLAACSAGVPPELTASLQSEPPGAGHEIGGSVDSVSYDEASGLLRIEGWHMFTPKTSRHDLKIYANNALSVESVTSGKRPDVAAAAGNEELLDSGYVVVLKTDPAIPLTRLCVSMTDKHYGARIMNSHSPDQPNCFPAE